MKSVVKTPAFGINPPRLASAFHYDNRTHVFETQQAFVRNRVRRWLWRKYSRTHGLYEFFTDDRLQGQYKLGHWPLTAAWSP